MTWINEEGLAKTWNEREHKGVRGDCLGLPPEGLAMTWEKGGLAKTLDGGTPCPYGFFDGNFFRPNFVLKNRACQAGGIDLMCRGGLGGWCSQNAKGQRADKEIPKFTYRGLDKPGEKW